MTFFNNPNFYKEHPKSCDPGDYWGQVKRTVNGCSVPQSQIDMIVETVNKRLEIRSDDILLDLCCGNGALTTYFFRRCRGGLGVDYSEYLINVAKEKFIKRNSESFLLMDAGEYLIHEPKPEQFTKALCYGSFQYLPESSARLILKNLIIRFTGLQRLFIGNLPDKEKLKSFYKEKTYISGIENIPGSPIGIWRTRQEFVDLAAETGWNVEFYTMPNEYYASHYRYDALLTSCHMEVPNV